MIVIDAFGPDELEHRVAAAQCKNADLAEAHEQVQEIVEVQHIGVTSLSVERFPVQ
jgi:hypothetical protein